VDAKRRQPGIKVRANEEKNLATQEELKKIILDVLPDVDCVIGWGPGPEPLCASPYFMRNPEDVDYLLAGPASVHNPALFLPEYKGRKTGVVVKGCDSRSVVQLISENLIRREDVVIIGFPCAGVVDASKIAAKLGPYGEPGETERAIFDKDALNLSLGGKELSIPLSEILADKCSRCKHPGAVISDYFAGEAADALQVKDDFTDLAGLESLPLEERFRFWEKEMSRCIRCYACRNACPLCVCRDHCVASSREPHWLAQANGVRDNLMFQVIHATHLAGRCTGCGECQRACPVHIPVLLLKRSLGRAVEQLFGHHAGLDPESRPPLLTFQMEETNIKEREW
jgi:ferredoxin